MSPVEWSPCRPRTIQLPLTASPCSRLSRPQSTISQSDFHPVIRPFSPLRLGRSYRLAPEPDGSPLFTLLPLVACWRYRTPGAPPTARVAAACGPAFPFGRQGRLLRSRSISGLFPVHFIPAYNLPVYASQRPLPDATQDSVRGCLLGFTAAVIADGRLQRACKAQRSSNRTGRFPASGSRTKLHAFTHGTSCPSLLRRTSPKWRSVDPGTVFESDSDQRDINWQPSRSRGYDPGDNSQSFEARHRGDASLRGSHRLERLGRMRPSEAR